MKNPTEIREVRKFHLRVLTPTHIGTREGSLRALEFAVHQKKVHLCDDDLLGQLLLEKGLLPRFVAAVEQGPVNLAGFLTSIGLKLEQVLPQISRQAIPSPAPEVAQMQEFRPFIRDGQGNLFLPGSAIKGVFRTAVLYRLMHEAEWGKRLIGLVQHQTPCSGKGREKRRTSVFFSDSLLQKQALQGFHFPDRQISRDPTTDILRCLTVRDAYPVNPQEAKTWVVPIDFLCKGREKGFYFSQKPFGGPLRVWVEALWAITFAVEISWDHALFEHFQKINPQERLPVKSLDDLMAALESMNQDLIAHERTFYTTAKAAEREAGLGAQSLKGYYDRLKGNLLRLGFGSGMLSTTVNLHLPPELRQKVRDRCGSGERPGEEAPKSRRVWRGQEGKCYPMGWAQMITQPTA